MTERTATVLFKDVLAGTLQELERGGTRFTYEPGWQQTIACSLPISEQEHVWANGLHPFFEHLAPEGWLREKQARAGGVSGQDDLGLLLQYGRDCIGAVSIAPIDETNLTKSNDDPLTNAAVGAKRTISGVQKKLLVFSSDNHFRPAGQKDPATHIAKFNDKNNDTLVGNESLSLKLAVEVLGPQEVTQFQVGQIEGFNETALIVTRFDRTSQGAKLRLEDFAQILSKPRGRDFHGKYDASNEDIAAAINLYSARPQIDVDRFFRRIVFSVIIGNADAHLKNFSLLETPEGLRLSPAYDLLNSLIYGGDYDRNIALAIGGEKPALDAIAADLLQKFGTSIGLPLKAVTLALEEIVEKFRRSFLFRDSTHNEPGGFRDRYAEIVRNSCLRVVPQ